MTNDVNPKRLIFVCSCVSRKVVKEEMDDYCDGETVTYSDQKKSNNLKGFIKRHNEDPCPYRLTFIRLENGEYKLHNKHLREHNHPAEDSDQVSKIIILKLIFILYSHYINSLGFQE